jgi:pimeloyl-ACP methyl ester carboxylesterase
MPHDHRQRHASRRAPRLIAPHAAWLLLPLAALLASCAALRPTPTPIPTLAVHEGTAARCLVVLLPGRHSRPEAFRHAGFGAAVEQRELPVDVVAADAHLGYYRARTVVERLHHDVFAPARGRYDEVWVAGTSLGGLGGLLVLRDYPADVDGVVALAPFLGDDAVIAEIAAAGGPRSWQPPDPLPAGDVGRELWAFLRAGGWAAEAPLYLGWGRRDSLAAANALLAGLLPAERVFTAAGGHDMATWRELWEQFLDRADLCGVRAPAARAVPEK